MKLYYEVKCCVRRYLRFFIDYSSSLVFGLIHGKSKELPPIDNPILLEPATELAAKIRNKELKSVDIVQAYIKRIQDVQPYVNAVVDERFEDAVREARAIDDFIESDEKSPEQIQNDTPLLGVPFTCKEAIALKGMSYTAGLYLRKGTKAETDAGAVQRMKAAGAIPVASTNVPELCMWWETGNYIYGTTNNPYHTKRISGGSTGGEGAIIASAGSVIGIGSDFGGSIRIPAFMTGVFGHKPSPEVVPNDGQFPPPPPSANSQKILCVGPLCRYATDLLSLLKVLSANDSKLHLDTPVKLNELKIYYMEDDGGNNFVTPVHPEIKCALRKIINHFEENYGVKTEKVQFEDMRYSLSLSVYAMSEGLVIPFDEDITEKTGKINIFAEIVRWCFRRSKHSFPTLFMLFGFLFPKPSQSKLDNASKKFKELKRQFNEILGENCVFLYPTHPEPAPYHHQTIFKYKNIGYTSIFNALQLPATHCPLGLCQGLPIGIQTVAATYNDRLTIAVAVELEKLFGGWVTPIITH